jgi:hypothetical protein
MDSVLEASITTAKTEILLRSFRNIGNPVGLYNVIFQKAGVLELYIV